MNRKKIAGLIAFAALACAAFAQSFTPLRPLFQLKTEHFVIIFPETCRSSAEYLYSMADGVFDEVAGKLDVDRTRRIPVTITDDSEDLNGSTSVLPLRITLYQAPISPDSGFARYDDNLRKLFLHELTHALSLTITSPFWHFLTALFCPDLPVMALNCPNALVEGVTVSFESADGYGRANDTPFAAIIRQDIIERKFKSFDEASGARGREYPFGIHYIYGGYFSRYLQDTYGQAAYAALWREMGKANVITGFEGIGPFKGDFEKVYGMPIEQAWAGFERYMALAVPVVTAVDPVADGLENYSAIASDGTRLYAVDTTGVRSYDLATGSSERLFASDGNVTRLFASSDGRKLLVSQYRFGAGNKPKAIVRSYDLERRAFEKTEYPERLKEAAWLADGSVVAAKITGYSQDLVRVRDGKEEVLFRGTESLCPSQPYPYGDGAIAFLLQRGGDVSVARMDLATGAVSVLAGEREMKRLRNLHCDGTTLSFVFDSDDTLLRLARYRDGALEVEPTLISGGVQNPVACAGQTYYVGYFSEGHRLLRYDESNPALALQPVASSWQPLDAGVSAAQSVYDVPSSLKAKRYSPIPWLFKAAIRYPLVGMNLDELFVNGIGFHAESMDPTESWGTSVSALYRWNSRFADASVSASAPALPVSASVSASDTLAVVSGTDAYGEKLLRTLGAKLTLSKTVAFLPATRAATGTLSLGASLTATGEGGTSGVLRGEAVDSPYGWKFADGIYPLRGELAYQDVSSSPFRENGPAGYALGVMYDGYFDGGPGRAPLGAVTARANAYLPFLNFRSSVEASFATGSGVLVGTTGAFLGDGSAYRSTSAYTPFKEYADRGSSGSGMYFFQDTGVSRVFKTHSPLVADVYMRSMTLGGGYRSALADLEYLHSAYAYLDLDFFVTRGMLTGNLPLKERIEISVPLSGASKAPQLRFALSFAY